jgi:hypothetical protein
MKKKQLKKLLNKANDGESGYKPANKISFRWRDRFRTKMFKFNELLKGVQEEVKRLETEGTLTDEKKKELYDAVRDQAEAYANQTVPDRQHYNPDGNRRRFYKRLFNTLTAKEKAN